MDNDYVYVNDTQRSINPLSTEVNFSLEKDNFEPIEYEDVKNEDAIFEVFKASDYTDVVSNIIQSIDNYYNETESYDDYPYFRIQSTCKFIPKLDEPSEILSEKQLRELHAHLPYYHQYKNLKLVYCSTKHGVSLKNLYVKAEDIKNSILVIKDENDNVFGAYASEDLRIHHSFYGTGEMFLFTFYKTERIHTFPSTGLNDYYIYSDEKTVCFGCSDNNFSLCVENDLLSGYSKTTQTFKNPVLGTKEKFFITVLELWTFQDK
jgi:hypothetical protein